MWYVAPGNTVANSFEHCLDFFAGPGRVQSLVLDHTTDRFFFLVSIMIETVPQLSGPDFVYM